MSPGVYVCLLLFAATAAVSAAITGLAVFVARRLQILAHPVARSSHSAPTPQVGGVGICLTFGAAQLAMPALAWWLFLPGALYTVGVDFGNPRWALIAVMALGLALGIVDDVLHLAARPKLMAQIVLAAAPLFLGISFRHAYLLSPWAGILGADGPEPARIYLAAWIGAALAFLWILFFINAFNFMDGVNGQSGVFALNALLWWGVMWAVRDQGGETPSDLLVKMNYLPLPALAGATVGFLLWNFPRAITFMGDSGSLPLGAALAVLAAAAGVFCLDIFIAFCFPLSLFIYDVLYTLVYRLRRGENLLVAHRSHLYQRLLIATGWSHARLLAFHLPFYLLSGLAGVAYFSGFVACSGGHPNPGGGLCRWLPPACVRIGCVLSLFLLLLIYTLWVWRFEKRRKRIESLPDGRATA